MSKWFHTVPQRFLKTKKKICFSGEKYEKQRKEPRFIQKGNDRAAICGLASSATSYRCQLNSIIFNNNHMHREKLHTFIFMLPPKWENS